MALKGDIDGAASGAHGFDANSVLSAAHCSAARAQGFTFAVRYLSRRSPQAEGDLGQAEAERILASGLGLMVTQLVAPEGWTPNQALGTSYGAAAAANASAIGLIPGLNVWLDLEGVDMATPAEDVIAYCNAWADEVRTAGFVPGLYVGSAAVLSGDQLYWRIKVRHYWHSGSVVPDIPHRGYQLFQRIAPNDAPFGIPIDRNVAKPDAFGDGVLMMVRR
jgi:hypothetical protein